MTTLASDDFTDTDGVALTTHSANWRLNAGNFDIQSNGCCSNATSTETLASRTESFPNDQWAAVAVPAVAGTSYLGPAVRCSTTASVETGYGYYANSTERYLVRLVAGVWTQLDAAATGVSAGNTMRLEVVGTTLTPILNGSTDSMGTSTDALIASGAGGLKGWDTATTTRVDGFTAGDFDAGAAGPTANSLALMGAGI